MHVGAGFARPRYKKIRNKKNMETKIEFYKDRTLGERFSAAGDFIRQNWKILSKNLMYIGVPLILLYGFFMQNYIQGALANINSPNIQTVGSLMSMMLSILSSSLLSLFFIAMLGALLKQYQKGSLTEKTGWSDLKGNLFSFLGKIFIQYLIISVGFILLAIVIGLLMYLSSLTGRLGATVMIAVISLVFLALMVIIFPLLALTPYPIFFENASAWQGIKKGFRLGFKHWGSTFLTTFLGFLLMMVVYYILSMPYLVYIMFNMGEGGFLGYVLAIFSSFVVFILYPVLIVFVGFQYTSIVEKEEGISLQDKIEQFDSL
jgi:hypothetical protein